MKLYKYHTINVNLLKSLHKKMNWYSRIDQLNDPYDSYFIDNTGTDVYHNLKSTFCVCCFSKNMSEILMWSHYADNHKGVCIEWDIDESKNKGSYFEIKYNNDISVLNEIELHNSGHLRLNSNTNGKFMYSKFKNWEYEEEIRIIKIEEDLNKKGVYGDFSGELTAIYFGKNSTDDDIELVKLSSAHLNNIKYFKVDLNLKTMKNDNIISL